MQIKDSNSIFAFSFTIKYWYWNRNRYYRKPKISKILFLLILVLWPNKYIVLRFLLKFYLKNPEFWYFFFIYVLSVLFCYLLLVPGAWIQANLVDNCLAHSSLPCWQPSFPSGAWGGRRDQRCGAAYPSLPHPCF